MNTSLKILVIALCCWIAPACNVSTYNRAVGVPKEHSIFEDVPPIMQIESPSIAKLNKPLEMRWKITNNARRPVFIYSTLLQHEYFVEFNANAEQKTIEVRFLRLRLWGDDRPLPYYFPKTEFARIDPGRTLEGRLVSRESFRQLVRDRSIGVKAKEEQITSGTWTIQSLVAYGDEIESVERSLAAVSSRDGGHPADPVVRWQKIARSEPLRVDFQE